MSNKIPALIQFRQHVDTQIQLGKLKAPEDPLIYAIKERQRHEVAHRIDISNHKIGHVDSEGRSYSATRSHLARIFYRDDILNHDDYLYVFDTIGNKSRGILLTQLVNNNCDGYDTLGEKNLWIEAFLKSYSKFPLEENEVSFAGDVLNDGRLLKLLSVHMASAEESAATHLQIEETLTRSGRAHRMNVELHFLKTAFVNEENSIPDQTHIDAWLDQYAIVLELRRENAKSIVGKTQVNLIQNQLRCLSGYESVLVNDKPKLEKVAQALLRSMDEDIDHLIEFMKQPASKAIYAFGKPENKGEGERIGKAMGQFSEAITSGPVEPQKAKHLLELMVISIISVNQKNLQKRDVVEFIDKVKDKVDWGLITKSLNSKGRAVLIDLIPDSDYIIPHLPKQDRGRVLEDDLGI